MNGEKNITLEVSVSEANILIAGLGKLPLEVGAEVWLKIRQQAQEQIKGELQEAAGLTD